ncbi:tachylectin-related carbohydrate-binding protein [Actinacidiphila rubida]|nr:tachylectin-related carbohydrate-binding protein [Actinacidiphila rubida]
MPRSGLMAATAAAVLMPLTLAAPALAGAPNPSGGAPAPASTPASPAPTAAAAAPHGQAAPAVPTGVVTQAYVPVVTPGPLGAGATRFTVRLPQGTTGQVGAVMAFDPYQLPPAGYTSWRVASHLHAVCSVNGGPFRTCEWAGGIDDGDDPLAAYLRLVMPVADATATMTYDVRITADYGALPDDQLLHGWFRATDADGGSLAVGSAQLQYLRGETPAAARGVLYARDATGELWRYEGTDTSQSTVPFKPPAKVGGGWNAYTAIIPLGAQSAAATGDVVARDKDGVLWYFAHSGDPARPFAPRVRIGAGWNIYTALSATSDSGARHADLVARDRDGVLWRYRATGAAGAPFAPRERIGAGWNAYTAISPYGDGIVARDASGVLWSYAARPSGTGTDPFEPRVKVGAGWNVYTALSGSNVANGAAGDSLMARDAAGRLWWYDQKSDHIPGSRTIVGAGWNIYTAIF